MVQEDRKILNTIWYRKHQWMGHVLWHEEILHDILEAGMADLNQCTLHYTHCAGSSVARYH